jgi:NTP pyrophosphatase (non-canonical NTP hydrolase)
MSTELGECHASLQKEEMAQLQKSSGDALKQIVTIAREHSLTSEHIALALKTRVPREKKIRVPKKNKFTQTASEPKLAQ